MADSLDDSAVPEGTKTFVSRTSNKGKDENQGALAKNVITPLVTFAKTSAAFVANCKRPEDQRKSNCHNKIKHMLSNAPYNPF